MGGGILIIGHLRDSFTDETGRQVARCFDELKATYRTEETEELQKKWNMSEEEINNVKNNIKCVK